MGMLADIPVIEPFAVETRRVSAVHRVHDFGDGNIEIIYVKRAPCVIDGRPELVVSDVQFMSKADLAEILEQLILKTNVFPCGCNWRH